MDYRFSEHLFRRCEHALAEAVKKAPNIAVFDPKPYTATTFSRRLRDARKSLLEFGWSTTVDVAKLRSVDFAIAERGKWVVTGATSAIAEYDARTKPAVGMSIAPSAPANGLRYLRVTSTEDSVIRAAIILLQHGELDCVELAPNCAIEPLAAAFDLVYERQPDKIILI